jgi:hypothetical protein
MMLPTLALAALTLSMNPAGEPGDSASHLHVIFARACAQLGAQPEGAPTCATAREGACRAGARGVTPEDLIAVAHDVSPEWGARLAEAKARDAEAFQAAMASGVRRLASLAVLKARKPALYALRVEEIRVQGEIDSLGPMWASARLSGRVEEASGLEARIRGLSGRLVDLNLRSRAMELAELDGVLRAMRKELEQDSRGREGSIDALVAACKAGTVSSVTLGRAPVDTLPATGQPLPASAAPESGAKSSTPNAKPSDDTRGAPVKPADRPEGTGTPHGL